MTQRESSKLEAGVYRLWWRDGGFSDASVGVLYSGQRWFAPCNWTGQSEQFIACTRWSMVRRVELLIRWSAQL
jgi:hypothetical protein